VSCDSLPHYLSPAIEQIVELAFDRLFKLVLHAQDFFFLAHFDLLCFVVPSGVSSLPNRRVSSSESSAP
jgi:hypothetical protein